MKNQVFHTIVRLKFSSVFIVFIALIFSSCGPPKPEFNERFKPKEPSQISPPVVSKPIYECAEAVHVTGFIPHADILVYANGSELIGKATPPFGYADIVLNRPLKLGESITATQTVGNLTSSQSIQPVIVAAYPMGNFTKPVVGADLFECGVIVPVGSLVPSTKVHVFEEGVEIGSGPVATDWLPVFTSPLHNGKKVTAVQTACEKISGKTISSPESDPVIVKPAPDPVPAPVVDANTLYPGNDAVVLGGLYVGAFVSVTDNGAVIGSGYITAGSNWVPLSQPLTSTSKISATQELCGKTSPPSTPVTPAGKLTAPIVLEPICAGSRFVVIRNTIINAWVVVLRNGSIVGYAGAVNGDLIVALGGNNTFAAGDKVQAYQNMTSNISPGSNIVTVTGKLEMPSVEIMGGEPFFNPEEGEEAIDGPVFPRGRGNGPLFLIQSCCEKKIKIEIKAPDGKVIGQPEAEELFPGYYSATWNWASFTNWAVPSGIPVGKYTVTVHSECSPQDVTKNFYVIFNPADVNGPVRFSYDETGIWFYAWDSKARALVYYLHPDDKRVFDIAIKAASGQTDSKVAAGLVARAEENLFGYDLNYHSNDVIDLMNNNNTAQCADDANTLASLFRSIGIPAHPTSADADVETGPANWTFDTWTEFLVPANPQPEWLIFHPHEHPGMSPETRGVFGTTRGVALKSFNDLIIMGGENWIWNEVSDGIEDVSFTRLPCTEPVQNINKKPWIGELCEQGYWSQTHWDCDGIGSSSSGLTTESIHVNMGDAGFGRSISGTIVFRNSSAKRISTESVISVVADLPESKKFPDTVFERYTYRINIEPGDTTSVPFRLKLPVTSVSGSQLMLQTSVGKGTLLLYPFTLSGSIKTGLKMDTDNLKVGSDVTVVATVSNTSKQIVQAVDARLYLPFALRIIEKETLEPVTLKPGETKNYTWRVKVIAPLEAGTVMLRTNSTDGGSDEIVLPIRISDNVKAERASLTHKSK